MVNEPATAELSDRRERTRGAPARAGVLGAAKLNPFGDLHSVQHLSVRFARALRGVFEPLVRQEVRSWAEPLVVQRFADYRAERPETLTAWLPMAMAPADGAALLVIDGRFALELLDLFFGGTGVAPAELPTDFSPAAAAMIGRLGAMIAAPLATSWEPLSHIDFIPGHVEANPALLGDLDGDDALIVTRYGIACGEDKPVFLDICYPVAAMKPHGTALTGKVVAKPVETDAVWQTALTRAAMSVTFPVRSVLAEPVVPISVLMNLKPGDVIPIHFTNDVPIMVGGDRLGTGTVGTANGHAAIKITRLASLEGQNA
jgi:flagellar motor switch protein FliM